MGGADPRARSAHIYTHTHRRSARWCWRSVSGFCSNNIRDLHLWDRPEHLRKHFGRNGERAERNGRQDEQSPGRHEMCQIPAVRLQLHILGKCGWNLRDDVTRACFDLEWNGRKQFAVTYLSYCEFFFQHLYDALSVLTRKCVIMQRSADSSNNSSTTFWRQMIL